MTISKSCDFEYERFIKYLKPFIKEEHISALQEWKSKDRAYETAWSIFECQKDKESTQEIASKSDALIAYENTATDIISVIFLETPDPTSASGLWDAGKEKATIEERERSIIEIKKIVAQRYAKAHEDLPAITQALAALESASTSSSDDVSAISGTHSTPLEPRTEGHSTTSSHFLDEDFFDDELF